MPPVPGRRGRRRSPGASVVHAQLAIRLPPAAHCWMVRCGSSKPQRRTAHVPQFRVPNLVALWLSVLVLFVRRQRVSRKD